MVYLLPLRWPERDDAAVAELGAYLSEVARWAQVVVVDASPPAVRAVHARAWGDVVRHLAVDPPPPGTNGKAAGVLAGLAATTAERVVVADDDVRYDRAGLARVVALLDDADLVRPQNVFRPLPWHARWDTARSLLNRAVAADYPGTLALRRSALGADGYDPHVLFENLELIRTVVARGGREVRALDVVVARRPPTVRRFAEQRVRQAYDSLAQPPRLAVELSLLPLAVLPSVLRRRPAPAVPVLLAAVAVLLAEAGRRRAGGARHFPATSALWAPAWVAERAVCAWLALAWWCRGGVPYAGTRLRTAAHPVAALRGPGASA